MNRMGVYCYVHSRQERCECDIHCAECKYSCGPKQDDCCTCCRAPGDIGLKPYEKTS